MLGEEITKEELGGPRFHTEVTGMADLEVDSDQACIDIIKQFLSYFPAKASMKPAIVKTDDPWDRREESLLTIVPESPSKQYDMRKVIQSIFNLGSIFDLKPTFAKNVLTILARLNGRSVGIVATGFDML